jgi:DNA polymerase-3 subunit alpha
LIGLSSCLKGEVAEGSSHQQDRKAIEAAAAYRDILGPNNFFLEMQWHGIEEQRLVNSGLPAIARDLGLPLICTNDVHYLQAADAHPHDILLHRHAKAFSDPKRLRYDAKQFFLKTAEEMAEVFKDYPDAPRTDDAHRRAATSRSRRERTSCRTSTCRSALPSTATSSTSRAKASRSGCRD